MSCVVHQVHQAAVEGQHARFRAELSKDFFVLPREGLSLFPKAKGVEDMGCDGDIGGGHVLDGDRGTDGGRHADAAHTAAST